MWVEADEFSFAYEGGRAMRLTAPTVAVRTPAARESMPLKLPAIDQRICRPKGLYMASTVDERREFTLSDTAVELFE